MKKFAFALVALVALSATAQAQCAGTFALVQPAPDVLVAQPGFAFQSFGAFGVFQPTNALFLNNGFGFGNNVLIANNRGFRNSVLIANNRGFGNRQLIVNRNGLFGSRTIIINR